MSVFDIVFREEWFSDRISLWFAINGFSRRIWSWESGGRFLAEYDALPGYGEAHDQIAHACGHNWIAASSVGAAIVLSSFLSQEDVKIVVIGTPAEKYWRKVRSCSRRGLL